MRTEFTPEQLKDPATARSNEILRTCVHCGFCTATCPTYQVLGDELDSPRGRIYLIKDMLENERRPDARTVRHIDRCLSCLACMTTCPSGVHYMHLVDHAREYIERHHKRPAFERLLRWTLARILPHPGRFRLALRAALLAKPFAALAPDARIRAMLRMAPLRLPPASPADAPQVFAAQGQRRMRVALMTGCAQRVLNTAINESTIRLLTRLGCEVVVAKGAGCCGALVHHMGKAAEAHDAAARNIRAWCAEIDGAGLDAVAVNASGCGTTLKDYGHMMRGAPEAASAERVAAIAADVSEILARLGIPEGAPRGVRVAYHSACSLQHGQKVTSLPQELLRRAGFEVVEPADSHLCCGSAGTYNLMQPEISAKLKERKVATLEAVSPDVVASGNIGCMVQVASGTGLPVVHTVELLDWATGGPVPAALAGHAAFAGRA